MSFEDVRNPIDQALRSFGFRARSKRLWDRQIGSILQVVHLDKSSYGPQNRVEVFFSFDQFTNASKYKIGDLDVKLNFDRVVRDSVDFKAALDLERDGMAPDIRATILQDALQNSLYPILELAVDAEGIAKLRDIFPSKNDLFIAPRTASIIPFGTGTGS